MMVTLGRFLHEAILRAASLLAPGGLRGELLREWRSELWYIPRAQATEFCLTAFRDALWVRRNTDANASASAGRRSGDGSGGWMYPESPASCLALLTVMAAGGAAAGARLERMLPSFHSNSGGGTMTAALEGIVFLVVLYLLMAATALAISVVPVRRPAAASSGVTAERRWRGWAFLTVKLALVLPILQCGLLGVVWIGPLPFIASCTLVFRWVFEDQRRRCPVCLRLLANPVRMGTASGTLLDWYGSESACLHGHGLLHDPAPEGTYSRRAEWLRLDHSWRELFR